MDTDRAWHSHTGSTCPVEHDARVYVRLRNGWESDGAARAGELRWDRGRTPDSAADKSLRANDIISYAYEQPKPTVIYVRFSDCGKNIRKWSFVPFDGGIEYAPSQGHAQAHPRSHHVASR